MKMESEERLQEINSRYVQIFIPVISVIAVLMVVGILGNPLVIYFYGFRMKPTASYMFIVTLACFDLLSCLVSMPLEIMDLIYFYTFENKVACKTLRFINVFACIGSGVTLVAIAIDRYRKICKPFNGQITVNWAKFTIVCCIAFSLISSWPSTLLYTVENSNITDDSSVLAHDCRYLEDQQYAIYIVAYNGYFLFLFFVTIVILIILYTLVGKQLFTLRSFRFYAAKRKSSAKARPMSAMTATSDGKSCSTGVPTENNPDCHQTADTQLDLDIETRERPLSPISEDIERNGSRPVSANSINSIAISARSIKPGPHRIAPSIDEKGNDLIPPEEFRSPGSFRQTQSFTEKTTSEAMNGNTRRAHSAVQGHRSILVKPIREPIEEPLKEYPRVGISSKSNVSVVTRDSKGTESIDTRKLKSQNINTRRYTIIAISISIAFVISFLPYLVLIIWSVAFFDYDPYKMSSAQLATCELFLRSFLFNGAFNPIIYGFLNSEFKDMVVYGIRRFFCCCCSQPQKPWKREHSST